jgi:uncharacterized protein
MFKVTKYPHGTFSWAECASNDASKGKQFYSDLMGWGYDDMPMGGGQVYTMFKHDGERVAAINPLQPEEQAQGTPSHWNNYVAVDNVDALADKATQLGGTVIMPPMDVFDNGRMLFLQDPTGAFVGLWQAKSFIGAGLVNIPGAMTWNELMTPDSQKARDFYGPLLGWTFQKMENVDYYLIFNQGRLNGGIMSMTPEMGNMPPVWSIYFSVANIEDSAAKVEKLGGKIHVPITEAPGTGRFVMYADPQGAVSYLIQTNQPQPWTE